MKERVYAFDLPRYLGRSTKATSESVRRIVIKPTNRCVANCVACASRRSVYGSIRPDELVSIEQWQRLFDDLKKTKLESITISGGEPTLYPQLADLIMMAKQCGWHVALNTNGWRLKSGSSFHRLVTSGVDCITISVDSSTAQLHDELRQLQGLWESAVTGLTKLMYYNSDTESPIQVNVRSILSRYNYTDLPRLVGMCMRFRVDALMISYIEADFVNGHFLLTKEQIADLKQNVIPQVISYFMCYAPAKGTIKEDAIRKLQTIFPEEASSLEEYSRGIYWGDEEAIETYCTIPYEFALVTPKGDVYPCNAIEYFGEPTMGNIKEESFLDIWFSSAFNLFRMDKCEWCRYCPMNLHTVIPLK